MQQELNQLRLDLKAAQEALRSAELEASRHTHRADEAEREAAAAARKAEREAEKARKAAEKAALPKRPRGRPKKVVPSSDAAAAAHDDKDDDFETDSDGEEKPCPPAPAPSRTASASAGAAAIHLDFGEVAEVDFAALREPSPRPTTPMRHIASLKAENAALRARLERAEAALAAIRAALP